ncbi:MAG: DNA polymerase III subunit gamma/tau [Puniceicoccales bacterium]|jgi:DNA polymerase-3 subunit gamma/tau|nr:DNA polymerase III subunit gamma/tau [Puniceicoccales bacterium]
MAEKSYEVTARRWRPRSFEEVVGQEHVVRTLQNALRSNRVAHAYIFVGPRGTGKTSMARLLAMELCGVGSEQKAAIWKGEYLDVTEIDGASHNSVEEVRELRERCAYAPAVGRYRVFIVDEVHMLSSAAFNALLKILEEPPAHVKFIFATTEVAKVPMTVLSRCQRFHFRPIAAEEIGRKLAQIAKAEEISAETEALMAIGRLAHGSLRDGQTLFDQMVTFCGGAVTERALQEMYSLPPGAEVEELARALEKKDPEGALAIAERWNRNGVDLHQALLDLQGLLRRDLLETFSGGGGDRHGLLELLRTLQRWNRSIGSAPSEWAAFSIALLEAIENSRRRPIDRILEELNP